MAVSQRFSLFLSPCADDFTMLEELIGKLAHDCGALAFEPHVTLYSGSYDNPDWIAAAAAAAVKEIPPFSLAIRQIGHGAEYFKSVFIEFDDKPEVYAIHDRMVEHFAVDSGYSLHPHLSLLYHDLSLEEKGALANSLHLDRRAILFDRVKVVTPNNPAQGWRDIAGWRTLWSARLTGGDLCEP